MDYGYGIALAVIALSSILLVLLSAAETALERTNVARLQALASQGHEAALRIVGTIEQPRERLGPLMFGRVIAAAGLVSAAAYAGAREYGALGGAAGIGMAAGGFGALLQVGVGTLVSRRPEFTVLTLQWVIVGAGWICGPPAFLFSLPARLIARPLQVVTPLSRDEDILSLLEREEASGGVEEQERRMIRGVIGLEDRTAREIMVPRIDIVAIDVESSVVEAGTLATEKGYSRIPVYRESIDDVVGIAYAKDLLEALISGRERRLADLVRKPVFIPESKRADQLLTEMRSTRTHLAIAVDEYGGTAGLITIEDLLEEIVGEIEDEYDVAAPSMEILSADEVLLDAGMPTVVLQELFDYEVEGEDFDTVGGFLIHELGRMPLVGDEVAVDGLSLRVLSMSGRRLRRLRVAREVAEERETATA